MGAEIRVRHQQHPLHRAGCSRDERREILRDHRLRAQLLDQAQIEAHPVLDGPGRSMTSTGSVKRFTSPLAGGPSRRGMPALAIASAATPLPRQARPSLPSSGLQVPAPKPARNSRSLCRSRSLPKIPSAAPGTAPRRPRPAASARASPASRGKPPAMPPARRRARRHRERASGNRTRGELEGIRSGGQAGVIRRLSPEPEGSRPRDPRLPRSSKQSSAEPDADGSDRSIRRNSLTVRTSAVSSNGKTAPARKWPGVRQPHGSPSSKRSDTRDRRSTV